MASPLTLLTLFATVALLSFAGTTARPCKTLFISYYSFSLPNPNPNPNPNSPQFLTVFTQFEAVKPSRFFLHHRPGFFLDEDRPQIRRPQLPSRPTISSFSMAGSLRDRTKDIISVVVALLFGVGCGFLTAATMYLAWSMFSNRFYDFHGSYNDDDDDDNDDDVNPKKVGYVKIPDADLAVATPTPDPVPAKSVEDDRKLLGSSVYARLLLEAKNGVTNE